MEPLLHQFIGEYELTDSIYNQKVVYKGINSSIALFYVIGDISKAWVFGNERMVDGLTRADLHRIPISMPGVLGTHFCPNVEYPANGECAYDWYYIHIAKGTINAQVRGIVQCTMY